MQDTSGLLGGGTYSYKFRRGASQLLQHGFLRRSVQAIPYTINPVTHDYLGGRNDGVILNVNNLF